MKFTRKIRPLFVSRMIPYLGGREIMVDQLVKSFSKNGSLVITPDKYKPPKGVKTFDANKSFDKILEWAKRKEIDVVNCHTFYLADLAIFLAYNLRKPLVFTLHGVFLDHYGQKYGELLKKIYDHSDKVITVSDNYNERLAQYLGNNSKLSTIKNGVPLGKIDKIKQSALKLRKKFHISTKLFVVVIPARLTYLKGLEYAVKAAKNTKDKDILYVICSPASRKNKEEAVYKNCLKSIIGRKKNLKFFTLKNGDVLECFKMADVVLLPSLVEGISISLLEAMALSRTVVATAVSGNMEIIQNSINGYLIKEKSPSDIINKIKSIKLGVLKPTGYKARKTIEKKFTNKKMCESYYKLFLKII